jgi:hypothetical protein
MTPLVQEAKPVKKIIKLTHTQAQEMLKTIKSCPTQYLPRTMVLSNTQPLTLKKTCGLFNEENLQLDIDKGHNDIMFNLNQSDLINDANEISVPLGETQSKFAKKLQSLNMKIKVPTQHQNTLDTNVFDLKLTEEEWEKLVETSNEFNVPNCDGDDSSLNFVCDTAAIEKVLKESDLFKNDLLNNEDEEMLPVFSDMTEKSPNSRNNVLLQDHVYTMTNKRNSSFLDDTNSQETFNFSFDSGSVSGNVAKKQRKRGIYRLDDVTNQEEYENYLERRIKNNISSKASRANKKSLYNEMDAKSDFLVQENQRLSKKIAKMEEISKIIKDMLVERFAGK